MMGPTIELNEINDLHSIFQGFRSHSGCGYWFRGQANKEWKLLPKAGRPEYYLPNDRDLGRFNAWDKKAIGYAPLPEKDLDKLALAQHHGLATRLLDWTMNPLVATYFACESSSDTDGIIYIFEPPEKFVTEETSISHLKAENGIYGYMPKAISPRILSQRGLFTVHCDASSVIQSTTSRWFDDKASLYSVIIPASIKANLIAHLSDYGIDKSFLFPDLDGLSEHINFETLKMRR